MDNLSKEDIDYIFKKGIGEHEFPFKESAWDNMENMLDDQDKKRALYKWSALGLLLLSGLFVGAYFYFNTDTQSISTKTNNKIIAETNSSIITTNNKTTTNINEISGSTEIATKTKNEKNEIKPKCL